MANQLCPLHGALLPSITSVELRKITFRVGCVDDWARVARYTEDWGLVDRQLCELVNRLRATGYGHTLEAELRLMAVEGDDESGKYDFTKFLPKFRERGDVAIVDHADRVLHRSVTNDR